MLTFTVLVPTPDPPAGSVTVPQMVPAEHPPAQADSPEYGVPALAWMVLFAGPLITVVGALLSSVNRFSLLVPVLLAQSSWVAFTLYAPSTSVVGLPDAQSPAATLQLVPDRVTANVR